MYFKGVISVTIHQKSEQLAYLVHSMQVAMPIGTVTLIATDNFPLLRNTEAAKPKFLLIFLWLESKPSIYTRWLAIGG